MKVYIAFSVGIIPPVVEVFAREDDRNIFALGYRFQYLKTLSVAEREVIEVYRRPEKPNNG